MSDKSNYLEAAVIDYFLRPGATAPTRPTSVKVGLLITVTDAEVPTVTEASYSGYARQDCGFGASSQVSGGAKTSNASLIDFPAVTGSSITVSGYAVYDHLDNVLIAKDITDVVFNVGDIPRINAAALTHTES